MTWVQSSACPQCGAPIYVEGMTFSILPPSPRSTCSCSMSGTGTLFTTTASTSTSGHITWGTIREYQQPEWGEIRGDDPPPFSSLAGQKNEEETSHVQFP